MWLIISLFQPLVALVYRGLRYLKKAFQASEFYGKRLTAFFNHRYVIRFAVVVIALSVTASNIYAAKASPPDDLSEQQSLLASLTSSPEEDLLIEEADDDTPATTDSTYLQGQAVSSEDFYLNNLPVASSEDDQADGAATDELVDNGPQLNAVWCEPESQVQEDNRPPTRTTVSDYIVQVGDTPESIAKSFGLRTTTVVEANGLGSRGIIRIGQVLRIPPVDGVIYKTKKGDTVSKIAKTYKCDAASINEINGLSDASDLAIGTELVLPGGRLPAPPVTKPRSSGTAVALPSPIADRIGSGELLWPVGCRRITQYFKRRHTGLDVGCPMRTPIYAADDGVVTYAGWNSGGYGNMVLIDHGAGLFTRYGHSTKLLVSVGQRVNRGDVIALVGSTGRSTGPHLHFEVMRGTVRSRYNPLDYIK